jgi:hypothetical protein
MTRLDAWTLARLVAGLSVNGELQAVSESFGPIARHLADLAVEDRRIALDGFLLGSVDGERIALAIDAINPEGPPLETEPPARPANLGDLERVMAESQWVWEGWIATARIAGIAAFEGVGKTRLAMDLARRIYNAETWPDGQPPTFSKGTPTLWVCSDGQQDDLFQIANACGMPLESVFFCSSPDDPYGGTDLDDPDSLLLLESYIGQVRPGLVFIDSLTNATARDLCQANQVKSLATPIRDLAQRTQTSIVILLHVAKDGQALGRRIKALTRTIIHLECPDPDQSSRLKFHVSKSFAKKPPPLGVTMGDGGNDYDSNPPEPPEGSKGGRPNEKREEVKRFVREELSRANGQVGTMLRKKWHQDECERARMAGKPKPGDTDKTFNRAVGELKEAGELTEDGGTGKGKQWTLRLTSTDLDPDHTF